MRDDALLRIGREISIAALGIPLETLDAWVIGRLTSILEEHELHAGQTLFRAGVPLDFLYFMRDGEVRFTRDDAPPWTLRGRWFLGAFDVASDRPAMRTATAVADFYAMRVSAADWVELLEDSFQLARSAVVNGSRALMRLEERVATNAPASSRDPDVSTAPPGVLNLMERLGLLLRVRMFRGTGVQALAELAAVSRQMEFAVGDNLLGHEPAHDHLILVVDGDALAERESPVVRRQYRRGDLVCAAGVLGGVVDGWQARATTPVRAIAIPIYALFDLMEEHFDLVRSTLVALGVHRELLLEHLAMESNGLILT
jgi:CRP-like cAMP-binding protein